MNTETPRKSRRRRGPLISAAAVACAAATAAAGLIALNTSDGGAGTAEAAPAAAGNAAKAAGAGALIWRDEFNRPAGTAPDGGKWNVEVNGDGGGNGELQYYTNRRDNLAHDGNGNMVITARKGNPGDYQCHYGYCQYTSGRMNTAGKFEHAYGRFEARIQIPIGQGIWPAFWMLGNDLGQVGWPNSGEIDIMENIGSQPADVHGSLHGPGYSGGNPITGSYYHPQGWAFADTFHTFAVEWSPNSITWFVDGNAYQTFTPADTRGNPWVYDHPFFMILNVAVGGSWPGAPDASTQFPQQMKVDYVRVYDLG
ncbi:glycoside hydrolase family 16 protein [Streptomonospora wellingtoniae]|uniref:Glycoside hydrolase family 16 protein n=1 Tax=Streptomonospora wellingtoniae TaxID=3075544 RepID=A0ABU2L0D8_9ACTN|nr:glycoside hydrolase family 16 protein [Streptomonospora sp. DSM 45055]MDT0305014.1 glycoside hydrolase family 16 protein [Streptomonospora sp. DSM 45055]